MVNVHGIGNVGVRSVLFVLMVLFVPALRADEAPRPLRLGYLEVGQTGTLLTGGTIVFRVIEIQGEKTVLIHQYARGIGRVAPFLIIKGVPTSNMMIGKATPLLGVFKVAEKIPGRPSIVPGRKRPDTFILEKIGEAP